MAHISSGLLKGLSLTVPRHIRATEEKVRQALFNIVGAQVAGARVLDGFAGSGALGLEALSRGASHAVFLESHPACVKAIQRNLARISPGGIPGHWEVVRGDVLQNLRVLANRAERFDLILLDPPYQGAWGKKALNVAATCGILAPAGSLCLEHTRRRLPPSVVGELSLRKQHRYGETVLSFYTNFAKQNL
jgi:16S rRNA (guanine(966)-N(2))-methyltransferase RsmD